MKEDASKLNTWCYSIASFYQHNPEFISGAMTGGFFNFYEKKDIIQLFLGSNIIGKKNCNMCCDIVGIS